MNLSIEDIKTSNLCTGCGTCAGMCPENAIEMTEELYGVYGPTINDSKCRNCGLCLDVCPGYFLDFSQLNKSVFGSVPENILLGNFVNCYLGYSNDERIRWNSSSGGLVPTLLIFMLEKGIIDGAVVTKMNEDNPLEPEVLIARTKKEIISSCGAKYCPVPANAEIGELLKARGKFAVVGLPCHIHGLRKAEMFNEKLREKIVLHLGLCCSETRTFMGTKFLLEKIGVRQDNVAKLDYRSRGWPGGVTVRLRDGSERFVPLATYYTIVGSYFFTPMRCVLCPDATNELSDVSFGDAWLPELRGDEKGVSVIISRSEKGERILKDAEQEGEITITNVSIADALRSKRGSLSFKKKRLPARLSVWSFFGQSIPKYNLGSRFLKQDTISFVNALFYYFVTFLSWKSVARARMLRRLLLFLFWVQARFSLRIRRYILSRASPIWV